MANEEAVHNAIDLLPTSFTILQVSLTHGMATNVTTMEAGTVHVPNDNILIQYSTCMLLINRREDRNPIQSPLQASPAPYAKAL